MGHSAVRKDVASVAAPQKAVTALLADGGWIIGLATENEPGYSPLTYGPYDSEEEALKLADHINKHVYGLTPKRALMVVMSSMFPAPPAEHAKRRATWPE